MPTTPNARLPPAVDAERLETRGRSGRLSYYVAGAGKPMLLLHSINAAASVREVKLAVDHAMHSHRVYAPDLPGYGFSDRSDRPYDIKLFCDAIRDMLDVIAQEHGEAPVDALGLSLSAEFLARVATLRTSRSPSGCASGRTGRSRPLTPARSSTSSRRSCSASGGTSSCRAGSGDAGLQGSGPAFAQEPAGMSS